MSIVKTMESIIQKLESWTGAMGLAFFSCSHINDTYKPKWACTDNAANFSQDALGHGMWDITHLLKMWACSRGNGRTADTPPTMWTECSAILQGTLHIMQRYQIKLVGWTFGLKIISPHNIHTIDDLRLLLEALCSGSCHWVHMSQVEMTKHEADYARRKANGEVVVKKRKQRSDNGIVKGPWSKPGVKEDEEAVAGPKATGTKCKHAFLSASTQVPPHHVISKEFIEDSESDSS
ncbi:hypothetical protein BYT27DRAFT_7222761 [Phlegmacium glaucopus]|nr:hypothetical protein BYT27DRAFT_7222761 [Phlegmacium glaucopus]